jgi:hypothetical protein
MAKSTHKKSSQKRTMRSKHTKRQTKKVRRNRKKTKKSNLKGGNKNNNPYAGSIYGPSSNNSNHNNLYNMAKGSKPIRTGAIRRRKFTQTSQKPKNTQFVNVSNGEKVVNGTELENMPVQYEQKKYFLERNASLKAEQNGPPVPSRTYRGQFAKNTAGKRANEGGPTKTQLTQMHLKQAKRTEGLNQKRFIQEALQNNAAIKRAEQSKFSNSGMTKNQKKQFIKLKQ